MKKYIFYSLILFLFSCDMINYHPYDGQSDLSNINQTNIETIENTTKGIEEFKFIWMGDTQRYYDETVDFVKYVNNNLDVAFVLHGGDITDFGMTDEFEWIHNIMSGLKVPYVALIGNHDILGTGDKAYGQIYGDTDFSFTVGDVRFVCLNTNQLEYDGGVEIPNFTFINSELETESSSTRTIVAMHAPPISEQINSADGEAMHTRIKEFDNLMFCMNAHRHTTTIRDFFEDDVTYYTCAAMGKRSFLLFTINKNGYEYEEILY